MNKKFGVVLIMLFIVSAKCKGVFYFLSGIEIKHSWVSDSTYKIKIIWYETCDFTGGTPISPTTNMCYKDTCGYYASTLLQTSFYSTGILPDGRPVGSQIKKTCTNFATKCDSTILVNSAISYKMYSSEALFTLPAHCGKWRFVSKPSVNGLKRDTAFTNIQDNYWYFVETDINNIDTNIKNTSAELINTFPFYTPINEFFSYSLAGTDIDGDSLVYHLVSPKSQLYQCGMTLPITDIPFVSPFTINEPFNTGGSFVWDSTNAIISFTAPMAQNPLISLVIDEYRNGVWVGNSMRDIPIVVLPISYYLPQTSPLPSSWVNTQTHGADSFYSCANVPMSFCTLLHSASNIAVLTSNNTVTTAIPGANLVYNNFYTDSVSACFSWLPTVADTGWHTFTITVKDTTCPVAGVNTPQTFAYRIYIHPASPAISMNAQTCNTYLWNGQTYTMSGTYTQTLVNANGCDSIVTLNLTVNSLNNTIVQNGFSLWSSVAGGIYQWFNCDNNTPIVGATNQGYSTLVGGNYGVVVNYLGCLDTSNCLTFVSNYTSNYSLANVFQVNPNPASDKLNIKCSLPSGMEKGKLFVYDLLGQIMYQLELPYSKQEFSVDISAWGVGQYYLKFIANGEVLSINKLSVLR